jgi:hypothetical protein
VLPEFTRTTTFRWTLVVSGALTACILLMFGFVLAHTYVYVTTDVDGLNEAAAKSILVKDGLERRIARLDEYLSLDPNNVKLAGIFAADGSRIAGNIETLPPQLQADPSPQFISIVKLHASGPEQQRCARWRAVCRTAQPW